jgi:hypothetical protein
MRRFLSSLSLALLALTTLYAFATSTGPTLPLAPAQSQAVSNVADQPGYVDFAEIDAWFKDAPSTEVEIQGPLVDLVAEAAASSDPNFSRIMGDVTVIQVRGFPLRTSRAASVTSKMNDFAASLADDGWRRVIFVRENDEQVSVYIREVDDRIAGITLLSLRPEEETVFVNVVGSLTPDQVALLGRGLNLSSLEQVDVSENTP